MHLSGTCLRFKTTFNFCSSNDGQHSVFFLNSTNRCVVVVVILKVFLVETYFLFCHIH